METQYTVTKWAEKTFGGVTLFRCLTRANEEMAELIRAVGAEEWDAVPVECADVAIVLMRASTIWDHEVHVPNPTTKKQNRHRARDYILRANQHLAVLLSVPMPRPSAHSGLDTVYANLAEACGHLGSDLMEQVEKKMETNRSRKWSVTGKGVGYHVRP